MKKPDPGKRQKIVAGILVFVVFAAVAVFAAIRGSDNKDPRPLTGAIAMTEKGKVEKIEVSNPSQSVTLFLKNDNTLDYGIPNIEGPGGLRELIKKAEQEKVKVVARPVQSNTGFLAGLFRFLPTLALILILVAFAYFSKLGPFGKVKVSPSKTDVNFDDVAGCGEAIEELKEVETFLSNPDQFRHLGARSPQGVLLYGPPGTGKTLLAKALATEAKVDFYAVSGSEFIEIYAGVGARRVRQLFEEAKKNSPAIIFIDEIDAIAGKRSSGAGDGASREADQTINEILRQMDGFDSSRQKPVIVVGATNRLDVLDPAIIRPGRFDRQIAVDPPDRAGRVQILKVHARGKLVGKDVDLERIAVQTAGMTGADLARLMNEAALHAARRSAKEISMKDIDDAYFRVVAGAKKQSRVMSKDEVGRVAYHESGHAIIGEELPGANVVHKISIIPRGRSGGQTLYVSEEDVFLYSKQSLRDNICSLLGGRAAEEVALGSISSGGADDLDRATTIAIKMVTELGMSEEVGLRVIKEEGKASDHQQEAIDREVRNILDQEYLRAKEIIDKKRDVLESLSEKLLQEEVIDRDQFLEIINC